MRRRATKVLLDAIVAFALVALAALGLGPHTGRYRTLTVLSGSMRPGMREGSLAIVVPESMSDVKVGQVIAYQVPVGDHHVVSHRVTQIVHGGPEPEIQTKGDANTSVDPWTARLTGSQAWRVRLVIPFGGWVVQALRNRVVRLVLVDGTPMLLCALWLDRIWRGGMGGRQLDVILPESPWRSVTGTFSVGRPAIRSRFSEDAEYEITRSRGDGLAVTAVVLARGGCWHDIDGDRPEPEWLHLEVPGGIVATTGGMLAVRITPTGDALIYAAKGEATLYPGVDQWRSLGSDEAVRLTAAGHVRPATPEPGARRNLADYGAPELEVLTRSSRFNTLPLALRGSSDIHSNSAGTL